jgi:excisionase family DNA binding protein
VKKGEKALILCMPITCKRTKKISADDGTEQDEEFAFTHFTYKPHWFVLSQTEGESTAVPQTTSPHDQECPITVRDAAQYLGVSAQTVYLWVERKQIPHLRVMGRNIRFLKSDLERFRASFRQEVENGKTK